MIVVPAVVPRAAAGEPGARPFLQLHIDQITPDTVTTTSEPVVTVSGTVTNVGDRPVRDVMVRLEHAPAVASSTALRTDLKGGVEQYEAVADFVTVAPELAQGQHVPFTLSYPVRSAELPSLRIDEPGIYPALVNVNGTPDYGAPARLDDARFLLPVLGVPPDPSTDNADPVDRGRSPRHVQTRAGDDAVAAGGQAPSRRGRAGRHHAGAPHRRRTGHVPGPGRPPRHAAGARPTSRPAPPSTPAGRRAARCVWPSTPTCWSR